MRDCYSGRPAQDQRSRDVLTARKHRSVKPRGVGGILVECDESTTRPRARHSAAGRVAVRAIGKEKRWMLPSRSIVRRGQKSCSLWPRVAIGPGRRV